MRERARRRRLAAPALSGCACAHAPALSAILSVALYLVPTGAHFFEMFIKLTLSPSDYMAAQKLYSGWTLFGVVIAIAVLTTALHAFVVRSDRLALALSSLALLSLVMTQVIFWTFTQPANLATQNWSFASGDFDALRRQWEYSHAASALFSLASLALLTASALHFRSASTARWSPSARRFR